MVREILLVRHPEAQKNLEDRHGGGGTSLTPTGIRQCEGLARYLRPYQSAMRRLEVYGHRVPQVLETLEYLYSALKVETVLDERLRGISLGLLAGLSRAQAAAADPGAAARLEAWRAGNLRVDRLALPGGEDIHHFEERVRAVWSDWMRTPTPAIVAILTRSSLNMLINIATLGNEFDYDRYAPHDTKSASITTIAIEPEGVRLVSLNVTSHLALGEVVGGGAFG
ncbi:MAG: histidine phosphatase family protein [Thermoplasmata archaeon]|nr:histidine phosphatase family protein [Thermoplasmata archaeon]